jgi:hypothetical protein
MIILNGKKFAETEKEFTNSLFETGGTCVGYARRTKRTIILEDHNKNRIGVINKWGVLCKASKTEEGKYWYSFGDIDLIGKYDNYMKEVEEPKSYAVCRDFNAKNETMLIFK